MLLFCFADLTQSVLRVLLLLWHKPPYMSFIPPKVVYLAVLVLMIRSYKAKFLGPFPMTRIFYSIVES